MVCFSRNHRNFVQLRPQLSRNENPFPNRVISDAVQNGLGILRLHFQSQLVQVEPARHLPCAKRYSGDSVGMPDISKYLPGYVLQFVHF